MAVDKSRFAPNLGKCLVAVGTWNSFIRDFCWSDLASVGNGSLLKLMLVFMANSFIYYY